MKATSVSVIIVTYKGAKTLPYVLNALEKQIYKGFDVLVVLKPSGDGTEAILEKFGQRLKLRVFLQSDGHVVEAEAIGLRYARGDVVVFFDDDAIPTPECIKEHVRSYEMPNMGGVAGDVILSTISNGGIHELEEIENPPSRRARQSLGSMTWNRPVEGLEQYHCCITKCGSLWHGHSPPEQGDPVGNYAYWRKRGMIRALLGMGANMSVFRKAVEDFDFDRREEWKRGFAWEQVLAWHVWNKGYTTIFNPKAKVHHVLGNKHLSGMAYAVHLRGRPGELCITKSKPNLDYAKERHLYFYRIYGKGKGLSLRNKTCSIMFETVYILRNLGKNPYEALTGLGILFRANLTGFRWLAQNTLIRHRAY